MEETIQSILALARQIAPIIGGLTGTPYVALAIKAGEAVVDLIDDVKTTAGSDNQQELQAARDEIVARVNAHADRTINNLGDDPA